MIQRSREEREKIVRVSSETHEQLRMMKEVKGCSFAATIDFILKKYIETNGEIRIALLNEYFDGMKKIFGNDEEIYGKIDTVRVYLIQKLRGNEKADDILMKNLIYNGEKKLVMSEMIDRERERKGKNITITENDIQISAMAESESEKNVRYRVEIEVNTSHQMYVFCSCPDFQARGMICKHIWQVIHMWNLERFLPAVKVPKEEVENDLEKIRKMMDG